MSRQHHSFHIHLSKKQQKTAFDKVVGFAAFAYPMTAVPQLVLVMKGEAQGVSVASWAGFALFSALFFVYGVMHRIKPMMVSNFLWIVVDTLVVVSAIVHQMI